MFLICSIKKNILILHRLRTEDALSVGKDIAIPLAMLCGDTIYGKGVYHALCLLTA